MLDRFAGFEKRKIDTGEAIINTLVRGSGEPLLLLHGYPQTHMMWHRIAPALAEKYTVVLTDLRGYGDSSRPVSGSDHYGYCKRKMAEDQVGVMEKLGYGSFFLAGHDRGARVCHQMLLDHPEKVRRAVLLDIIPTTSMYELTDAEFAKAYYHWFLFIQKYDLPERLIQADPGQVVLNFMQRLSNRRDVYPDDVISHYIEKFSNPEVIHATCEDYRAGASLDLCHLREVKRKIECPLLVLWAAPQLRRYPVLDIWREYAKTVSGFMVKESGHYIAEEAPEVALRAMLDFFDPTLLRVPFEGKKSFQGQL